jgi:hypothetical protein
MPKLDIRPITDPLTDDQTKTLRAYVTQDKAKLAEIAKATPPVRSAWHLTEQALVARGFLQKPAKGCEKNVAPWRLIVTPEGLAAAFDVGAVS